MEGLFTFIIIVVWVLIGLLNVLKKRAEMAEKPKPGQKPRPAVPTRPARPAPRQPTPPSVFTRKREAPVPGERPSAMRPRVRRMPLQPSQRLRPPAPAVLAAEELFERGAAPGPREVPHVPWTEPPRPSVPHPAAPLQRKEARQRFRFSENPIVNGIIFSELFGPPVAKRPFLRRRVF